MLSVLSKNGFLIIFIVFSLSMELLVTLRKRL